ncbi:MAG: CCA tRNA nucleotidyltransferase, partial [Mesorhizobium sp.]
MSAPVSLAGRADWLNEKHLQRLLAALSDGDEQARVAGGAVRNTLLGQPVAD